MRRHAPMNYADMLFYLSTYPPDAPILIEWLSDPDCDKDFDRSRRTVGQVLENCREIDPGTIPRLPGPGGRHLVVGVMFGSDSPLLIMTPFLES